MRNFYGISGFGDSVWRFESNYYPDSFPVFDFNLSPNLIGDLDLPAFSPLGNLVEAAPNLPLNMAPPAVFELSSLLAANGGDGTNGFVINGIDANDQSGISVSNAGDINGDGIDDILIGALLADPNGNDSAGETYVVFGRDDSVTPFSASFDLSTLNGSNGFIINGIDMGDFSGGFVSAAGDFNGDGFDDILIGAGGGDPNGETDAGETYIVFGRDGSVTPFAATFDLSTLGGSNGFVINGVNEDDFSGRDISSAGDINGDGFDDILIAAAFADPDGNNRAGESYVVFGRDDSVTAFGSSLNLSTLNGTNGFVINGIDAEDFSGRSISGAGDINGDGFDDILIGASRGDPNGESAAGESYVIFGRDDSAAPFAAELDLSALDGTNGFVIDGVVEYGISGRSISSAGDINGDGFDDILIGASGIYYDVGGAYIVFGRDDSATPFNASFDLSTLNGTNGFSILPQETVDNIEDNTGWSVSDAGDINGDGFDDILIGAFGVDTDTVSSAGGVYVIFGRDDSVTPFAANMDLDVLNGTDGLLIAGVNISDFTGWSVSGAGDVNDDGFDDILVGAPGGDPNGATFAGESYIIYGSADFGPPPPTGPTPGNDNLIGTPGNDTIDLLAGDDIYRGRDGNDVVLGNDGNDTIYGQGGNDDISGGTGNDTLLGGLGDDLMNGGGDDDFMNGQGGDDTMNGGAGADTLLGASGNDTINGDLGDDDINGNGGNDTINGGDGNDTINGAVGFDVISGFNGDDIISGGNQNDTLNGNGGNDTINGDAGNDIISGGGGNDNLTGAGGQDTINGGGGSDMLFGSAGGDDLFGDAGNDVLDGGGGNDNLNGGTGADVFVANLGFRTDRVQDFEDGIDLIDFSANSLANDFADVLAAATQVGANVRIDLNVNNILILEGFDLANLDVSDFIF